MSKMIRLDLLDPSPLFKGNDQENVAQLIADIDLHGLHNAVLVFPKADGRFEIIAGHDRTEAYRRMGKTEIPATVRSALTEEQRESVFHRDNLIRKQGDKRAAVEATLLAHTDWSDRQIAQHCGVGSHHTVTAIRESMVATGQIAQLEKTTGLDGKERPAHKPRATGSIVGKPKPAPKDAGGFVEGAQRASRSLMEIGLILDAEKMVALPDEPEEPQDEVREVRVAGMRAFHRARVPGVVREFVSNALSVAALDDEDIAGLDTNDAMIAGLKQARNVLDRIIAKHNSKGAHRANA